MLILFIVSALLLGGAILYKHYTTDTTMPEIRVAEEPLSISIADGTDALMSGVTAYDAKDGDITDKLILQKIEMGEGGEVSATYCYPHAHNNIYRLCSAALFTEQGIALCPDGQHTGARQAYSVRCDRRQHKRPHKDKHK